MGYDLTKLAGSEFIISHETDFWQEGNPFVGRMNNEVPHVVWDAAQVGVPGGDAGDIGQSDLTPVNPSWLNQTIGFQRSPIFVNLPGAGTTVSAWLNRTGEASMDFPGYTNTEVHAMASPVTPVSMTPAPRESLAGDGRYLVWQELRVNDDFTEESSWDVVVCDLSATACAPVVLNDGTPFNLESNRPPRMSAATWSSSPTRRS